MKTTNINEHFHLESKIINKLNLKQDILITITNNKLFTPD